MNRATSAKSIALLRPKMQIFKNKLSFNILVACYYIANSVDIKERETVESCQIYFITKLKYNLRKLNTEGLVRSSLVINCCNTAVECLHGCCIKKTFSHGYFKSGNYQTCLIERSHMKFRHILVYGFENFKSKIIYFLMSTQSNF